MTRCPCCGGRHLPLMDRVRAALEMEPEASVHRLMWLTGDRRPEMVATMARMVELKGGRGTVQTPPKTWSITPDTCAPGRTCAIASLQASSIGAGGE